MLPPTTSPRSRSTLGGIALFFGALLLTFPFKAQGSSVVINEVFYDAVGSDTGHEWIELFNSGGETVDLGGWVIERGGATFSQTFSFPSGTSMSPGELLVVGESAVTADLTAVLAFQNGGESTDGIRLVDTSGAVMDVLLYDAPNTNTLPDESGSAGTSFAPDVPEGSTLARIPDGRDTNTSGADFQRATAPTLKQQNESPASATPSPSASFSSDRRTTPVIVSEVLPDPTGSDTNAEFVELLNPSNHPADVSAFQLDDADGGSTPYRIPSGTILPPGAYRVFLRSETKVALNNDGDKVRLLSSDGAELFSTTYEAVPREGVSWARHNEGNEWTMSPTPGSANTFTPLEIAPSKSPSSTSTASPRAVSRSSQSPSPSASSSPRTILENVRQAASAVRGTADTRSSASTPHSARESRGAVAEATDESESEALLGGTQASVTSPTVNNARNTRLSLPAILAWVAAGAFGLFRLFVRRSS